MERKAEAGGGASVNYVKACALKLLRQVLEPSRSLLRPGLLLLMMDGAASLTSQAMTEVHASAEVRVPVTYGTIRPRMRADARGTPRVPYVAKPQHGYVFQPAADWKERVQSVDEDDVVFAQRLKPPAFLRVVVSSTSEALCNCRKR